MIAGEKWRRPKEERRKQRAGDKGFIMEQSARNEILGKLKLTSRKTVPPRPDRPSLRELSLSREELIEIFSRNLQQETGIVHRVKDRREALEKLSQIAKEEGLKKVMVTTDDVLAPLNLAAWGKENDVRIMTPQDFGDRDSFRDAAFGEADAGVTGADFAVAESGTLGLIHNEDQARLVSLAPILHIAIVPVDRMAAVYEQVIEKVFRKKENLPSQFCFITGPSMTADIRGIPFKGMHGPRKVIVILVG
jgi:L-lactate dehydrogenase complex protein LldG